MKTKKKPSIPNPRVLLCPCVVLKSTKHVHTQALNMNNKPQKTFRGIFVGIPQHQKRYLTYVTSERKVVSSHAVVFDENNSSALVYTSCLYSDVLSMRLAVSYTPYATSSHEQTGKVITFSQFEEGN